MISSYGISTQFIFGVRSDIDDGLHCWDERKLVYVAGHNVIDYNIEENQQKFYSPMEGSVAITALTMSPQRALIAFAEMQQVKAPVIHIYDKTQRKRRSLIPTTIQANSVLCHAFATTKEERNILVLYGAPEFALIYWRWDSSTIEATLSLNTPIENPKCSFSPADPVICVLTGKDTFMFIKIEPRGEGKGDSLIFNVIQNAVTSENKEVPKHSTNYCSHCWTSEATLILGTDNGEIIAIDSVGQFENMMKISARITCLTPYSRGVIVGGECMMGPTLFFIEYSKEGTLEPLKLLQEELIEQPKCTLRCLSVRPNIEGSVYAITSDKQLLKYDMVNRKVTFLISAFHSAGVTGLDVCVRKPLLVTCSEKDGTIRIWNYIEKRQELCYHSSEMISVIFGTIPHI